MEEGPPAPTERGDTVREIIVRILVPDGIDVRVQHGDGGSGKSYAATQRPSIPPTNGCSVHGLAWKWIPPGVSKTKFDDNGNPKPYQGFWTCPERNCNEKPPQEQQGVIDVSGPLDDDSGLPF